MTIRADVARKLLMLRKERSLTQEALAARAELSTRFLQSLESGSKQASIVTLFQLAKALDILPQDIFQDAWEDFLRSE